MFEFYGDRLLMFHLVLYCRYVCIIRPLELPSQKPKLKKKPMFTSFNSDETEIVIHVSTERYSCSLIVFENTMIVTQTCTISELIWKCH